MPKFKNVTIAGLALALMAVAMVAWRQGQEIERLRQAGTRTISATLPMVAWRDATGRHVEFPPSRDSLGFREDQRPEMYGQDFRFGDDERRSLHRGNGRRSLAMLVQNPEFLTALGTYQQGVLDSRFAGLFRKLNLSGTELAAFKRLLTQKESAEFDVVAVGETISDSPLSPEELRSTVRTVQAQVENEIRASLGSDRYAVYQDYAATLPQRATVAQLEQRLSYSATPLTPAQSESMVRILAIHASPTNPVVASPTAVVTESDSTDSIPLVRHGTAVAVVTDDAVAQAQTVLSAEQLDALHQIQNEQHSAVLAGQLLRAAYPGTNPPRLDWKFLMQ
ncbi:MAG: hypothetical protein JWM35_2186 [Verrucomicrobia bacterium]|nr:hypothetical protein [Verrucomicrobiota bacterium]